MSSEILRSLDGVHPLKMRFLLWKRYFDTGYGITSYIKYLIALFGISSLNIGATIGLGFLYALFCFLIGWLWYRYDFVRVDTEISNHYNDFVKQMREKMES